MKKTDIPVVNVIGDNNRVEVNVVTDSTTHSFFAIVVKTILITIAVLAVSLCCPELLSDFVRWIISIAIGG